MRHYIQHIAIVLSLLFASCQENLIDLEKSEGGDSPITFVTEIAETRGTSTTTDNLDNFGVYSNNYRFYDTEVNKSSGYWDYGTKQQWALNGTLSFQAYAPYATTQNGITPSFSYGKLTVNYVAPKECVDLPDLLLAQNKNLYNEAVTLKFKHAMAKVQFNLKGFSASVKVKSVELLGSLAISGSVTLDSNDEPAWSNVVKSGSTSYFAKIDESVTLNPTISNKVISDDGYFLMIPANYEAEDARINVVLENPVLGEERITYLFKTDIHWKAGEEYTYTLEREIREVVSDYTSIEEGVTEDSNCYMVHPYNRVTQVVYIPISRRIDDYWQNYANESDYTPITAATPLSTVVTSFDTNLDDALRYNRIEEVGFAAECVSSGYKDTSCAQALKVTIPDGLTAGNVVVAVRDDEGKTLWSWHIWITNYNPNTKPIKLQSLYGGGDYVYQVINGRVHKYGGSSWTSGNYKESYIMDRNIGEWEAQTGDYNSRRGVVYQFGRKDPFLVTPSRPYTIHKGQATRAEAVQNPNTFYANTNNWCSDSPYAFWNDSKASVSKKSIFDPSPLGWRLPGYDVWSDFYYNIENYYYKPSGIEANMIYYPSLGYYNGSTGEFETDDKSHNWSGSYYSGYNGYALNVGSSTSETKYASRSNGYYVRPIRDL